MKLYINKCKWCGVKLLGGDSCFTCREKLSLIRKIQAMIKNAIRECEENV